MVTIWLLYGYRTDFTCGRNLVQPMSQKSHWLLHFKVMKDEPKFGNEKHQEHRAHMGLSENSVPLNPMVLLIIIPTKWL